MKFRTLLVLALLATACGPGRSRDDEEDPTPDASENVDAGAADGGGFDAGAADGGSFDAGEDDGGSFDAGEDDGGSFDAGEDDGGSFDAGEVDGGSFDGGAFDGGGFDGGGSDGGSTDGGTVLGGETCGNAYPVNLAPGVTRITDSNANARDDLDFDDAGGCVATGGPDLVYAVSVPAGQRLVVKATPLDSVFDLALNVVSAPTSRCASPITSCAARGRDSGAGGDQESLTYINTGSTAATLFVVIDTTVSFFGQTTPGGRFELELSLDVPPPGDVCATATRPDLSSGSRTILGETTTGFTNDYGSGTNCLGTSGFDRVYAITVPPQRRLNARATTTGDSDVSLNLVDAAPGVCGAPSRTCLTAGDSVRQGTERVAWTNRDGAPRDVFLVVDSIDPDAGSTFDLALSLDPLPTNDTCANPTVLTLPASLNGDSSGATADYTSTSCSGSRGPDLVYQALVPAGKQLRAAVRPATGETGFDPSIAIVAANAAACETAYTCLASDDSGTQGTTNVVRWVNLQATAQPVFVVVDAYSSTRGGPFVLEASVADPPPGDQCETAIALAPGAAASGTTVNAADDYGSGDGCSSTGGPDVAYAVTIPAGKMFLATATGLNGFDPELNFSAGSAGACGPDRVCQSSSSGTSGSASIAMANDGSAPLAGFLVVESYADEGSFQLATALTDIPPGETCVTAERLAPATTVSGTTAGYQDDFGSGSGCSGTGGPDRIYLVDVPPGKQVIATVTPASGFDASLQLVQAPASRCASPRTCLASSDRQGSGAETARWTNRTTEVQPVFVVVDSYGGTGGSFGLQATLADPPPAPKGDLCADAEVLALSTTPVTVTSTLIGAQNDYDSNTFDCAATAAPEVFYAVTIPAGRKLTATVTPVTTPTSADFDPSLVLVLGSCPSAGADCAESADTGLGGDPDTLTYTNTGTTALSGYLVVDSYYRSVERLGPFTLTIALAP